MFSSAANGRWHDRMTILSAEISSKLQRRLSLILPKYLRDFCKYEPLWLESDYDLHMRIKDAHTLEKERNISSYDCLRNILGRMSDEKLDKVTETFHRLLGSRYGWILELYARFYGVNFSHYAFKRLWICLSDKKRKQFARIIYLMPHPRYCQLKKLLYSLPNERYRDFVNILDAASDKQFNHYIRVLSVTDCRNPVDKLDGRIPGTLARPFTNEVPVPLEEDLRDAEWCELQHRILNLPFELRKTIELALWDIAFRPGKIFPHNQQSFRGKYYSCGKFYDPPIPRLFHALNKKLYTEMRQKYWSDNIWVVGYGESEETMDFLYHVPDVPSKGFEIKLHLELRFSSSDIPLPLDICPSTSDYWKPGALNILPMYRIGVQDFGYWLRQLWANKLAWLLGVKHFIQELTLDLNEAFLPGDEFAAGAEDFSYHQFRYLLPPVLKVRAPTRDVEDQVYKSLEYRQS